MEMTTNGFAATPAGQEYFDRYDRVLDKWAAPVVGRSVTTEHGVTHVNVCGPDDGTPVVLLPGAGASSTSWFAVAGELAETHRVYAVDLLGDPGRSVAGSRLRTVDDLLGWLSAVLDALGLESVTLVGHSYGAMVALAFALRNPDKVCRLVLVDPNACFAGMRPGYLLRALPLLLRPTAKRQRALIGWETAGSDLDRDWLDLVGFGAEHFPATRPVVPRRPSRRDLADLRCPTTVVLAERSRIHDVDRVRSRVTNAIPAARTRMLDSATHYTLPMAPAPALLAVLDEALR